MESAENKEKSRNIVQKLEGILPKAHFHFQMAQRHVKFTGSLKFLSSNNWTQQQQQQQPKPSTSSIDGEATSHQQSQTTRLPLMELTNNIKQLQKQQPFNTNKEMTQLQPQIRDYLKISQFEKQQETIGNNPNIAKRPYSQQQPGHSSVFNNKVPISPSQPPAKKKGKRIDEEAINLLLTNEKEIVKLESCSHEGGNIQLKMFFKRFNYYYTYEDFILAFEQFSTKQVKQIVPASTTTMDEHKSKKGM
jgi:hypothetical protein